MPLEVHRVLPLVLAFRRKMYKHGSTVKFQLKNRQKIKFRNFSKNSTYSLKDVGALVEIDHGEEETRRIAARKSPRIRDDRIFVVGLLADLALALGLQRRQHDDYRVVARRIFHVFAKFVAVEANDRLAIVPVDELANFRVDFGRLGSESGALAFEERLRLRLF